MPQNGSNYSLTNEVLEYVSFELAVSPVIKSRLSLKFKMSDNSPGSTVYN